MAEQATKASNQLEISNQAIQEHAVLIANAMIELEVTGNVYREIIDIVEKPMIEAVLIEAHGNQSKAASALGMNRATLRAKLKRHGMI